MPGIDNGIGNVAAAVPYSWEAAPGKPIEDILTDFTECPQAPLPPPPGSAGVRRPAVFVEHTFDGFEPALEFVKASRPHFAEKILKKLHTNLKRRSKIIGAVFAIDSIAQHKERVSGLQESVQSVCHDPHELSRSWSSSSRFDQPHTPLSTDSGSLSSRSSPSSTSTSWESVRCPALHQEDSQALGDSFDGCLSGPRECAWHQESDGEDDEFTDREWQIVRYASLQRDGRPC